MSIYHGKLIELLSIDRKSDKSFLHIKLSFHQDVELLWEIDNNTADLLNSKINFEKNYKFRLSLHSSWDESKKQYTSFLTKTYRDYSEKITFSCSEEYHLELHSIKNMKDLRRLTDLPYLSLIRSKKKTLNSKSKKYGLIGWIAVATISISSTILVGYMSHSCIAKSFFCAKKPAKAESIASVEELKLKEEEVQKINQPKVNTNKTNIQNKQEPDPLLPKTIQNSKQTPVKVPVNPTFPTIKLNNVVNYSIPKGSVALTFDDGPSKYSKEIVNQLKKYKAGGTFFYIGQNVKRYPEYVKYAHTNGYSIGSHSMYHKDFTKLTYKTQENDMLQTSNLIKSITNQNTILFRPPYGAKNKSTIELMQKHQYKMVLWNKDTEDWKNHDTNEIIRYVQNNTESGSIILLHESKASLDALPKIIEYLHSKKLQIVSLN